MRRFIALAILVIAPSVSAGMNIIKVNPADLTLKYGVLRLKLSSVKGELPDVRHIAVRIIGGTRAAMAGRTAPDQNGCRYYDSVFIHPRVISRGPGDATLDFGGAVDASWVAGRNFTPQATTFVLALQTVDDWGDLLEGQGTHVPLGLHDFTSEERKAYNDFVQACADLTISPDFVTTDTIQEAYDRRGSTAEKQPIRTAASTLPQPTPTSPAPARTPDVPEWKNPNCATPSVLPTVQVSASHETPALTVMADRSP